MARWLKGIAHLSAFDAIEQIKHAADEEEKKCLIQMERERRKKNRYRTNVIIVAGLIIKRIFDILILDYAVSVTVSGCTICMTALTVFYLKGLIKSNR